MTLKPSKHRKEKCVWYKRNFAWQGVKWKSHNHFKINEYDWYANTTNIRWYNRWQANIVVWHYASIKESFQNETEFWLPFLCGFLQCTNFLFTASNSLGEKWSNDKLLFNRENELRMRKSTKNVISRMRNVYNTRKVGEKLWKKMIHRRS